MNWELLWDYFGNFNDREAFRILTAAAFLFGVPLTIGLFCKTVAWSVAQVAACRESLCDHSTKRRGRTCYLTSTAPASHPT